ncbi:hypothetical protein [Agromyces arachidis]|uniref:hypothetical protein n=1 Tax=Agromyces arachidis TaxID=766966 RepID=UPI004057674F
MSDINTPVPGEDADLPREHDEDTPPEEMSSYDIQPPPAEAGEIPGAPDERSALGDGTDGEPGANATGVGV